MISPKIPIDHADQEMISIDKFAGSTTTGEAKNMKEMLYMISEVYSAMEGKILKPV